MKIHFTVFLLASLIFPVLVSAQAKPGLLPLVQCGTEQEPIKNTTNSDGSISQIGGEIINSCTFNDLLGLISRVVSFVLFYLTIPLAAIMFAYAGFLLLFSGGNSGQMQRAKEIASNVVVGLILALGAWLIVTTILWALGYKGWNPFV